MERKDLWENPGFITRIDEWVLRGKPKQNPIDWNFERWGAIFPEHLEFLRDLQLHNLGYLGRDLVRDTVERYSSEGRYIEGFLAVMIWGYGDDARGPWRTKRILDQPIAREAISKSYQSLMEGKLIDAYRTLIEEGPDFLGPAFGTKYLYFAAKRSMHPKPVILDSLVSIGLKTWGNFDINPTTALAQQYLNFLLHIQEASEMLTVTPEELELVLFSETAKLKGNQAWSNRQQTNDVSANERKAWGLLLASEILLRNPDCILFQTYPGGGQYDCLSIRNWRGSGVFKADLNLKGSIRFFHTELPVYNWEDLVERGAVAMCEMISTALGFSRNAQLEHASPTALAIRKLARLAIANISNPDIDIQCVVSDDSVYGQFIHKELPSKFSEFTSDLSEYPELDGMPKETWFWAVKENGNVVGLVDTFLGVYHSSMESLQMNFSGREAL